MAALTSLIQQGAAADVYKSNLIDAPAEVLTFGLSLFGCFVLSLLLGVCIGWKLFKGSGGGGGGMSHSPFGTGAFHCCSLFFNRVTHTVVLCRVRRS